MIIRPEGIVFQDEDSGKLSLFKAVFNLQWVQIQWAPKVMISSNKFVFNIWTKISIFCS